MVPDVVILAGGKGTRLSSVIRDIPKPMASIANRPFLSQLLNQLQKAGFQKVIMSVGYKHEVIESYYGPNFKDIKVEYCIEHTPLGTGGGIRLALQQAATDDVLVINGDTFFDIDFSNFFTFHEHGKYDFSLALKPVAENTRYGSVQVNDSRITGFVEKGEQLNSGMINGGIYLVKRNRFLTQTSDTAFSLETEYLETLYQTGVLGGYIDDGYFIDIGIPEDYKIADEHFRTL